MSPDADARADDSRRQDPAPVRASFVPRLGLPIFVYDLIVLASLAVVGAMFLVAGVRLADDPRRLIDPGTVPAFAGGLLLLLSAAGIVQALRNRRMGETEIFRPFHVLLAMALVLIFPPAIDQFGYYATASLWVPAFAWTAGARHWSAYLVVLVVVLSLARFVFEMTLGTPLP